MELEFVADPGDPIGRWACMNTIVHMGGDWQGAGLVTRTAGRDIVGLPWLISRAWPLQVPPPRRARQALTFVGLRPATLARWVAPVSPRAAVAGLIAEDAWTTGEDSDALTAAVHAFEGRFGHEPWGRRTPTEQEAWDALNPDRVNEALVDLASDLAASGDPWIETVATAYEIEQGDLKEAQRWALDVLADDPDPATLAFAANELVIPHIELDDRDRATLRRVIHEHPEHAEVLASYAARDALAHEGCTDAWLPELELALEHTDKYLRSTLDSEIHALEGQLAVRGRGEADTWQSGLVVAANECARHASDRGVVRGTGVYQDAWAWQWEPDDAFSRCLSASPLPGTPPPAGQRVEVRIAVKPPSR